MVQLSWVQSALLNNSFDHIWSWVVPEDALVGITGKARQQKIDELCRVDIEQTLRNVRECWRGGIAGDAVPGDLRCQ